MTTDGKAHGGSYRKLLRALRTGSWRDFLMCEEAYRRAEAATASPPAPAASPAPPPSPATRPRRA